jgi:hypothetical protein
MSILPYSATFEMGSVAQSTQGSITFSEFQMVRSIAYYLYRNFGYLDNMGFQTYASFESHWKKDGLSTDSAYVGEEIECLMSISTNMRGTLTLEILKDLLFDEIWVGKEFAISEDTETFSQNFLVDPNQLYDWWVCAGYFARAKLNGYLIPSPSGTELLSMSKAPVRIILDQPVNSTLAGSIVTFTGRLINEVTGEGVTQATIEIYESDWIISELLAIGTTNIDGTFSISWIAQKGDWWDATTEVYAKFEGTSVYESSQSEQFVIIIP